MPPATPPTIALPRRAVVLSADSRWRSQRTHKVKILSWADFKKTGAAVSDADLDSRIGARRGPACCALRNQRDDM